jgi:Putative peptidoglycan binding domain
MSGGDEVGPRRRGSWPCTRRRPLALVPVALALALCVSASGAPRHESTPRAEPSPSRESLPRPALSPRAKSSPRPKSAARTKPSPRTVLAVRRIFHVLGYPLGRECCGRLGVDTRGALSYFQHKYGLPVTGYPDARTVAEMRAVAASLRAAPAGGVPQRDLVDRLLGGVPILPLGLACALGLSLLALSARRRDALPDR